MKEDTNNMLTPLNLRLYKLEYWFPTDKSMFDRFMGGEHEVLDEYISSDKIFKRIGSFIEVFANERNIENQKISE